MSFNIHNIDTKSLLTRAKVNSRFQQVSTKVNKNIQLNQRLQQLSTKCQHSNGQSQQSTFPYMK